LDIGGVEENKGERERERERERRRRRIKKGKEKEERWLILSYIIRLRSPLIEKVFQ